MAEWYAYNTLDPIGEGRDDYRFSFLMSMVTNLAIRMNTKKGTNPKLTSVKDFIFDWDAGSAENKGTQTMEEMKNVFEQIAASSRISKKEKERLEQRRTHKPVSHKK